MSQFLFIQIYSLKKKVDFYITLRRRNIKAPKEQLTPIKSNKELLFFISIYRY
ncbi:MAG: hypothetical protein JWN78_2262 [Bacteroidota bacterium]|nr:hypothetical protein [Bacteroidota bacterium]